MSDKIFDIWAQSRDSGAEVVDSADSQTQADYLCREYRLAYGSGWRIWAKARQRTPEEVSA